MKVLALVGDADTERLTDRIAEHLAERGTVGRVRRDDAIPDGSSTGIEAAGRAAGAADWTVRVSRDEGWTVTGETPALDDILDDLAVSCDYALVEGYGEVDLPRIVVDEDGEVGEDEADGEQVLASGAAPGEIDVAAVIDSLETVDDYETLESLVAAVKRSDAEQFAGAIATFTGRVRAKEHEDDAYTEHLEFECYDGVAAEKMRTIREELESRDGVLEVRLHHKTGVVEAGEDIVFVVVLAGHRTEAFRTVEDGINRLKDEVPLFKKEVTVDDEFWAHTGRPE